jgi:hypothetical protein
VNNKLHPIWKKSSAKAARLLLTDREVQQEPQAPQLHAAMGITEVIAFMCSIRQQERR